jgi:hypothetical protein
MAMKLTMKTAIEETFIKCVAMPTGAAMSKRFI